MAEIDDVLEKLTEAVADTTDMMGRVLQANEDHARLARASSEMAANFREEIRSVKHSLEKIIHVLHEGNGQKPLISRVDILETKVDNILTEKLVTLTNQLNDKSNDSKKNNDANITGAWYFKGAMLTAIVAIITTALTLWAKIN